MKNINWFTVAALITIIALVTVCTPMIILTTLTLDHVAVISTMGFAAVTAAVLSFHFRDK